MGVGNPEKVCGYACDDLKGKRTMINGRKVLALIPARAGSKGIKDKNIRPLLGKPLMAYSIEAALKSKYMDKVIVSTDGQKIAEISERYGASVPFLRPPGLAGDTSKTIDAVLYTIRQLEGLGELFDILVLLQPTQPLRTVGDIDGALLEFMKKGQKPLVSVSLVDDHPLLIRSINDRGELSPLLRRSSTCRRQDMPPFYRVNGAIYINKISGLDQDTSFNDNKIPFIMETSHSVDIDEPKDLAEAAYYLNGDTVK